MNLIRKNAGILCTGPCSDSFLIQPRTACPGMTAHSWLGLRTSAVTTTDWQTLPPLSLQIFTPHVNTLGCHQVTPMQEDRPESWQGPGLGQSPSVIAARQQPFRVRLFDKCYQHHGNQPDGNPQRVHSLAGKVKEQDVVLGMEPRALHLLSGLTVSCTLCP